jgi:hypothetical protein
MPPSGRVAIQEQAAPSGTELKAYI